MRYGRARRRRSLQRRRSPHSNLSISSRNILVLAAASAELAGWCVQRNYRLVRTAEDRGRVVILDPRVLTKPYGRVFLDSLPPAKLVVEPYA